MSSALGFALLVVLTLSANQMQGSQASTSTKKNANDTRSLSRIEIGELLRQPNGLAKAAQIVGRLVVNSEIRPARNVDLQTLAATSSLIVIGSIIGRVSRLSDDGDSIDSSYTVLVDQVLKGNPPNQLSVSTVGGLVQFPNGTSAEMTSVTWQRVKVGQHFVMFLNQERDQFSLANRFGHFLRSPL